MATSPLQSQGPHIGEGVAGRSRCQHMLDLGFTRNLGFTQNLSRVYPEFDRS